MPQSIKSFLNHKEAKRILFTGGGSTGHVAVNLALIPKFLEEGWEIAYVGSREGIERELISQLDGVRYYPISTGKLRRYWDMKNFLDPLKVMGGVFQASRIIHKWKPHVIFSKGGFVSVPVVIGGFLNRVPTIIHESDITPGLANRIALPFASKVLATFPETRDHIKGDKTQIIGPVVRESIKQGDPQKGRALCGFTEEKPVLLVAGGSLGSVAINEKIRSNLDVLLKEFQIVHLCGKGKLEDSVQRVGYKCYEYLDKALPDVLAMTDVVVSRAGSNMIFEFLALRKPMLLIPLPKASSRGDQLLNAESFVKSGYAKVLYEEEMTDSNFLENLNDVYDKRHQFIENMENVHDYDSLKVIMEVIMDECKKQ